MVFKVLEVLNSKPFCPEIGRRSIIDVPQASEILVASLYHECKRPAGKLELEPRPSLNASIEALAAFRLSPPAVKEDVINKLLIFMSSPGTESPKIREAVLKLQRRLSVFDALMKHLEALGRAGDQIAKVCSTVSSPPLHDMS